MMLCFLGFRLRSFSVTIFITRLLALSPNRRIIHQLTFCPLGHINKSTLLSIGHFLTRTLASQKSVFAHVVVGNTASHTISTWADDIELAAAVGIDAFVLNIVYSDLNIPNQVSNAFAAAEASSSSFKLFFSFDYVGGGASWPAPGDHVVSYLNQYKNSKAYFRHEGKPMVSTFQGINSLQDWAPGGTIRSSVGHLYFVPDWSSLGPQGIIAHIDKIDGAFCWDMWPVGRSDMTTRSDEKWQKALGTKSYMMGVSPWFFRSASGGKKWIWRGDDLWAHRWAQTVKVEPDFVQIASWNDYGESHYIGPIRDPSEIPAGSAMYVDGMPHERWLDLLPYYIARYKGEIFQVSRDQMQYWYRDAAVTGGTVGGVVGNNANHGQVETSPDNLVDDKVFFSALLKAPAEVRVQIGNNTPKKYLGRRGMNHWSQSFGGQTGIPQFSVVRNGTMVSRGEGRAIHAKTTLGNGYTNYNAWVGGF